MFLSFKENTFEAGDICILVCTITYGGKEYTTDVEIEINEEPACESIELSSSRLNLFDELEATLNNCYDADGLDQPLTYSCATNSSADNNLYSFSTFTLSNKVTLIPLSGANNVSCLICDTLDSCIVMSAGITVVSNTLTD